MARPGWLPGAPSLLDRFCSSSLVVVLGAGPCGAHQTWAHLSIGLAAWQVVVAAEQRLDAEREISAEYAARAKRIAAVPQEKTENEVEWVGEWS